MKPLMVYDGDCGFCRHWIARWKSKTGDRIDYAPYQEAAARFPSVPIEQFKTAVQFIDESGRFFSGAEAVFLALSHAPRWGWLLGLYRESSAFAAAAEWSYRFVARNRFVFSPLTKFLWGSPSEPPSYRISLQIFIRVLGLIYFAAFVSLGAQILGLIGSQGILPARDFLDMVRQNTGINRYLLMPTFFWINCGDTALRWACAGGAVASLFVAGGLACWPLMAVLWALYLSLATVGQDFLWFQWDSLLLETGFIAIWLLPLRPVLRPNRFPEIFGPARWLLWWLLFRLMFLSGVTKWLSGDPSWHALTALDFHYHTQPLPTWIAWYADKGPALFRLFCTGAVLAIEILLPFLIFGPRMLRMTACGAFVVLQVCIIATGNYCFFNYLSLALCLPLIDDSVYPASWRNKLAPETPHSPWRWNIFLAVAALLLVITGGQVLAVLTRAQKLPAPLEKLESWAEPFRSANHYGLFSVMTVSRPEIIVEGSDDKVHWLPYGFKYKPDELYEKPGFVAPHQPRLDWQMWFASLGSYRQNEWFVHFCARLLQGTPSVLALLEHNPFPDRPPRYIRALVYEYRFTTEKERQLTRQWWERDLKGLYCPVWSLKEE